MVPNVVDLTAGSDSDDEIEVIESRKIIKAKENKKQAPVSSRSSVKTPPVSPPPSARRKLMNPVERRLGAEESSSPSSSSLSVPHAAGRNPVPAGASNQQSASDRSLDSPSLQNTTSATIPAIMSDTTMSDAPKTQGTDLPPTSTTTALPSANISTSTLRGITQPIPSRGVADTSIGQSSTNPVPGYTRISIRNDGSHSSPITGGGQSMIFRPSQTQGYAVPTNEQRVTHSARTYPTPLPGTSGEPNIITPGSIVRHIISVNSPASLGTPSEPRHGSLAKPQNAPMRANTILPLNNVQPATDDAYPGSAREPDNSGPLYTSGPLNQIRPLQSTNFSPIIQPTGTFWSSNSNLPQQSFGSVIRQEPQGDRRARFLSQFPVERSLNRQQQERLNNLRWILEEDLSNHNSRIRWYITTGKIPLGALKMPHLTRPKGAAEAKAWRDNKNLVVDQLAKYYFAQGEADDLRHEMQAIASAANTTIPGRALATPLLNNVPPNTTIQRPQTMSDMSQPGSGNVIKDAWQVLNAMKGERGRNGAVQSTPLPLSTIAARPQHPEAIRSGFQGVNESVPPLQRNRDSVYTNGVRGTEAPESLARQSSPQAEPTTGSWVPVNSTTPQNKKKGLAMPTKGIENRDLAKLREEKYNEADGGLQFHFSEYSAQPSSQAQKTLETNDAVRPDSSDQPGPSTTGNMNIGNRSAISDNVNHASSMDLKKRALRDLYDVPNESTNKKQKTAQPGIGAIAHQEQNNGTTVLISETLRDPSSAILVSQYPTQTSENQIDSTRPDANVSFTQPTQGLNIANPETSTEAQPTPAEKGSKGMKLAEFVRRYMPGNADVAEYLQDSGLEWYIRRRDHQIVVKKHVEAIRQGKLGFLPDQSFSLEADGQGAITIVRKENLDPEERSFLQQIQQSFDESGSTLPLTTGNGDHDMEGYPENKPDLQTHEASAQQDMVSRPAAVPITPDVQLQNENNESVPRIKSQSTPVRLRQRMMDEFVSPTQQRRRKSTTSTASVGIETQDEGYPRRSNRRKTASAKASRESSLKPGSRLASPDSNYDEPDEVRTRNLTYPTYGKDSLLWSMSLGGVSRLSTDLAFLSLRDSCLDTQIKPWRSCTLGSKDVISSAWAPDGLSFVVGTSTDLDANNIAYNRKNNLMWCDMTRSTMMELDEHKVKRDDIVPLSSQTGLAARTFDDPCVYTTISDISYGNTSTNFYTSSFDNTVKVWDVQADRPRCVWTERFDDKVQFVANCPNSTSGLVATAQLTSTNNIRLFRHDDLVDPAKKDSDRTIPAAMFHTEQSERHRLHPAALLWAPPFNGIGNILAVGFGDTGNQITKKSRGDILLWDAGSEQQVMDLKSKTSCVYDMAWHPILPWLAAGISAKDTRFTGMQGVQSNVRIWVPQQAANCVFDLDCLGLDIHRLLFHPTEPYISAACTNGTIYHYDTRMPDQILAQLRHGLPIAELDPLKNREEEDYGIQFLSWNAAGTLLYSGSSDGVVKQWNPFLNEVDALEDDIATFDAGISTGNFSPDYTNLLIGTTKGSVHVLSSAPVTPWVDLDMDGLPGAEVGRNSIQKGAKQDRDTFVYRPAKKHDSTAQAEESNPEAPTIRLHQQPTVEEAINIATDDGSINTGAAQSDVEDVEEEDAIELEVRETIERDSAMDKLSEEESSDEEMEDAEPAAEPEVPQRINTLYNGPSQSRSESSISIPEDFLEAQRILAMND